MLVISTFHNRTLQAKVTSALPYCQFPIILESIEGISRARLNIIHWTQLMPHTDEIVRYFQQKTQGGFEMVSEIILLP